MAESYLYNPSESINKGMGQVQANLANMFSGIIAQKQNDYNIAEKTFENINGLTDKLGEYGQEEITSKTTALLDDAAKSIIKNGKLDYSEVGRIRSGVSTIKNRKAAIEAGTQMYKEMAQTALATKDDLLNLGVTLEGMRNVILNPNNLSAEDMGRQMQAVYQKNINTPKAFNDLAARIAPTQTYEQTYSKDGATFGVAGKKVSDYVFDPNTGKFTAPASVQAKNADGTPAVNPDGTPKMVSYSSSKYQDFIKAGGSTIIEAIKKQMGENSVFQNDEQLFDSYFNNFVNSNNTIQKNVQVESANKILKEKQDVELGKKQLANFDTKAADEHNRNIEEIKRLRTATEKDRKEMELMDGGVGGGTVDINQETNTKTGFLGKRIPLSAKGSDGKPVNMAVNSIEWVNGKQYYVGYQLPKSMGYVELAQAQLSGMPEVRVPVNSYNKTQLNANINTATKKDIPLIRKSIAEFENTPMETRVVKSYGTPEQKARAKKEGRQILSLSQAREQYGDAVSKMSNAELYKALEANAKEQGIKALIIN